MSCASEMRALGGLCIGAPLTLALIAKCPRSFAATGWYWPHPAVQTVGVHALSRRLSRKGYEKAGRVAQKPSCTRTSCAGRQAML